MMWLKSAYDLLSQAKLPETESRLPRSVSNGRHTWEEFMDGMPCKDRFEVQLFYRRVGVLIALAQACRVQDLHGENLIAVGAFPIPIDAEVVAAPLYLGSRIEGYSSAVLSTAVTGVEASGLLPAIVATADGARRVESTFAARHPDCVGRRSCIPSCDGQSAFIEDHVEEVVAGYRLGAIAIRELISSGMWKAVSEAGIGQDWRFVPRPTALYYRVFAEAISSAAGMTTEWMEYELERMIGQTPPVIPALTDLCEEESWSLFHGDIPRFSFCPDRPGEVEPSITHLEESGRIALGVFPALCDPACFNDQALHQAEIAIRSCIADAAGK
jgi:lantibiotic modifying enzyme